MEQQSFDIEVLGKKYRGHYITDLDTANQCIHELMQKDILFGVDSETAPFEDYKSYPKAALSPHLSHIRLIQVFDGKNSIIFDRWEIDDDEIFKEFLSTKRFVAHNAIFDLQYFMKMGIENMNIGCTLLLAKLIVHATRPTDLGLSLEALAENVLGIEATKKVGNSDWGNKDLTFEQVEYAALDPLYTLLIAEALAPGLEKYKLERVYKLYKDCLHPVASMQLNGLGIDEEAHKENIEIWRDEAYYAREEVLKYTGLDKLTGHTLAKWLEENLDEKTKAAWPRTDNEKNPKLKTDAHTFADFSYVEVAEIYSRYQKKDKLLSTFGDNLLSFINPKTKRIHPSYSISGARTGRMSCSSPNCYSGDTEILTEEGWKEFSSLKPGLKVAQWKDGVIDFVSPDCYFVTDPTDFISITNQHIDLLVTPEHRCLFQDRRTKEFKVRSANEFLLDAHHLHSGHYSNTKDYPLLNDEIRLIIATQADGSWTAKQGLDFSFYKERKIARLKSIVQSLEIPYREVKGKNKRRKRFVLDENNKIVKKIYSLLGKDKLFDKWLLKFSSAQLELVGKEIFHWDGLYKRKSNYCSKHKQNADWIQIVNTLINKRTNLRVYSWNKDKKPQQSLSYQLDITNRNYSGTANVSIVRSSVLDHAYCVSIPSSFIIVRRKGKVSISGNCQQLPRDECVRNIFVPAKKGEVFVSADFSQIELRCAAEISRDKTMLSAYREGIDLHALTASEIARKPLSKVTKEDRQKAKAFNFGLLFGLGSAKFSHYARMAYKVEVSEDEAKRSIEIWRELYAGYREWQLEQAERCENSMCAYTVCGKRARLTKDNFYGTGLNHPVQGTAAEIMMHSLVHFNHFQSFNYHLVNCVHDEITVQVRKEAAEDCKKCLEGCMTAGYKDVFPNGITRDLVEAKIGESWGAVK